MALAAGLAALAVGSLAHAQAAPVPEELPGVGALLLRSLLSLGVVCGLLYLALRVGLGRWVERRARRDDAHLALVSSLPLGARRAVHLVRAGERLVLVGSSEHGLHPLGEVGSWGQRGAEVGGEAGQERVRPASEDRGEAQGGPREGRGREDVLS